jgi:hypothetical protein
MCSKAKGLKLFSSHYKDNTFITAEVPEEHLLILHTKD